MRIDVHSHLFPRCFWRGVAEHGSWYGGRVIEEGGERYVETTERRAGPVEPLWDTSLDRRIEEMDRRRVDVHVLSTPPHFFHYTLPAKDALASSREINDEFAEARARHPKRFRGLATVPLQDTPAAIGELERAMANGLAGAEIATHVDGRNLDDAALFPFFEAAQELGAFLFVHPNAPVVGRRTPRYHLSNLVGFPVETTIAVASMLLGGVLERLPRLTICFSHGGGYALLGAPRWDRGYAVHPDARSVAEAPPSESLRRIYVDSMVFGDRALRYVVDSVGADRVLMGSDYPFTMGDDDSVGFLEGASALDEQERAAILGGTAARLLGIESGVG